VKTKHKKKEYECAVCGIVSDPKSEIVFECHELGDTHYICYGCADNDDVCPYCAPHSLTEVEYEDNKQER
jgi:hypothetical protein